MSKCPTCNSPLFRVYAIKKYDTCAERFRECQNCHTRYVVMEITQFVRTVRPTGASKCHR